MARAAWVECAVWPVGVVVLDVDTQDVLELAAAHDQEQQSPGSDVKVLQEVLQDRRDRRRSLELTTRKACCAGSSGAGATGLEPATSGVTVLSRWLP